jgi:hypothetical protein
VQSALALSSETITTIHLNVKGEAQASDVTLTAAS